MKIRISPPDKLEVWIEVPTNANRYTCTISAPVGCTVTGVIGVGVQRFIKEGEVKHLRIGEEFVVMDGLQTIAQGRCEVSAEE